MGGHRRNPDEHSSSLLVTRPAGFSFAGYYYIFIFVTDVDSLDWKDPAPEEIVNRVVNNAQNGSIILFHNAAKNTPEALPDVIQGLKQKGFTFQPVSKLIYKQNFTMDHTGRQIPDIKSHS